MSLLKWKSSIFSYLFLIVTGFLFLQNTSTSEWGFFAHRRINRLAVFTLPTEMIGFYKKNLEYLTEHAIDADKRRYASRHEAVRHYINLDKWGEYPYANLPKYWTEALLKNTHFYIIAEDTTALFSQLTIEEVDDEEFDQYVFFEDEGELPLHVLPLTTYRDFFKNNILPQYYEDNWTVSCDSLEQLFGSYGVQLDCQTAFAVDGFSKHGILPYHLQSMAFRLTTAFEELNHADILRHSADMGHYLSDAHVPLHTTSNYNGQFTDQLGIHAFWESRLPELFADDTYDFFVGKAEYVPDLPAFFWKTILESNALVDSVLTIEKKVRASLAEDAIYCFEERGEQTLRLPCRDFAAAYQQNLDGMVEKRMRQSIHALGSVWFTCWVNAGQPDLSHFVNLHLSAKALKEQRDVERKFQRREILGREH